MLLHLQLWVTRYGLGITSKQLQANNTHISNCITAHIPHLQRCLHCLLLAKKQQAQRQCHVLGPWAGQLRLAPVEAPNQCWYALVKSI